MADKLPPDAKMRACIEAQVNKAEDITLLSRTIIKDNLAKKLKLSKEQRTMLDDKDLHYRDAIKTWISEAVDKKPDELKTAGTSSGVKSRPPSTKSKSENPMEKASRKSDIEEEEEEDKGIVSEFSSLEDDEEPKKKKPRKSKTSPPLTSKSEAAKSTDTKTLADSTEIRLKKLKALVVMCGTRKQWKKLFEEAGCPDDETVSEQHKSKARKDQIAVVEKVLLEIGMTQPFTKAKAAEVQRKKELKQEVEAIQVANMTEKSTTRGGKALTSKTKAETPEKEKKIEVLQIAPSIRKFNKSLADFAAELNDD